MSVEIRVPQLPESVADATLVAWHKQPGEAVSRDENLADLETDKVVLEVPAPANGVLREIRVQSGTVGHERRGAGGDRRGRCRAASRRRRGAGGRSGRAGRRRAAGRSGSAGDGAPAPAPLQPAARPCAA